MNLKNKRLFRTFLVVALIIFGASIAAYYGPSLMKTKEVAIKHNETGEKNKPVFLGEFRVPDGTSRLSWANKKLYILTPEEILVYSSQGKKLNSLPIGIQIENPSGFVAAEDRFFVADDTKGMAYVFNKEGKFWFRFPARAADDQSGERKLKVPTGLHRMSGVVYATDGADNMVKSYNSDGLPIIDFSKGQKGQLGDLTVTDDGRLAVFNRDLKTVQLFTCDGRYIYDFDQKASLTGDVLLETDGLKRFMALDQGQNKILVYDNMAYYLFSFGEGKVNGATDLAVSKENRTVYVLVPGDNRVRIWGY